MTVRHDTYLFNPEEFATYINTHIQELAFQEGSFQSLQQNIIELFDTNENLPYLADYYGVWDKLGVIKEMEEMIDPKPQDLAFCVTLLIYSQLTVNKDDPLGFGTNFGLMQDILYGLGWDNSTTELLIQGKNFESFAQEKLCLSQDAPSYWKFVLVGSFSGWISLDDVENLLAKLISCKEKFFSPFLEAPEEIKHKLPALYESSLKMLSEARDKRKGLCFTISM